MYWEISEEIPKVERVIGASRPEGSCVVHMRYYSWKECSGKEKMLDINESLVLLVREHLEKIQKSSFGPFVSSDQNQDHFLLFLAFGGWRTWIYLHDAPIWSKSFFGVTLMLFRALSGS